MSASFEEWARGILVKMHGDISALKAQHQEHLLSHQRDAERNRYAWSIRVPSILSILSIVVAVYAVFYR